MLSKEISSIDSSKKALREFGVTLACFFALVSAFLAWRSKNIPFFPIGFSSFFFIFGLWMPEKLKTIQKIWMTMALLMGWVMTRVILIVVFYFFVTPTALLARLFGHSFLRPVNGKSRSSYWVKSKMTRKDLEEYKRQF